MNKIVLAVVVVMFMAPMVFAQTTVFSDNFDRADSGTVGNGWAEEETYGEIEIISNELEIDDSLSGDPGPHVLQDGDWATSDDDVTLSLKIKNTEAGSGHYPVWVRFHDTTGSYAFTLAMNDDYDGFWEYESGGTSTKINSPTLDDNTWYELQMVFDLSADTVKFYIDGGLKGTESINSAITGFDYLQIQGGGAEYNYKIYVDNVFVTEGGVSAANGVNITEPTNITYFSASDTSSVDVEFTAAEDSRIIFADDYDLNLINDNITLYIPFESGSGATAYDYSGNSNDGTIYNMFEPSDRDSWTESDLNDWYWYQSNLDPAFNSTSTDSQAGTYSHKVGGNITTSTYFRMGTTSPSAVNATEKPYLNFWLKCNDSSLAWYDSYDIVIANSNNWVGTVDGYEYGGLTGTSVPTTWTKYSLDTSSWSDLGSPTGRDDINFIFFILDGTGQQGKNVTCWLDGLHFSSSEEPMSGKYGNGLKFDGEDDSVNITDDTSLRPSEITLSAWIKPQGTHPNSGRIIDKPYDGGSAPEYSSYLFRWGNSGTGQDNNAVYFDIGYSGGRDTIGSTTNTFNNKWSHIVGTYDGSQMKIYVDGELENSKDQTNAIVYTADDLIFGEWIGGSGYNFNGTIDEVMIFNRALNSTEIDILYENSIYMSSGTTHTTSFPDQPLGQHYVSLFDTNQTGHVTHIQEIYYTLSNSVIVPCDGGSTVKTLNFTYFNEENTTQELVADIDLNVEIGDKNYSFSYDDQNSTAICICGGEGCSSFDADIDVKYDARFVNDTNDVITDFSTRWYILKNVALTNSSRNITLYSLSEGDSTDMKFDVVDTSKSPLVGKIVRIQRYYPETDEYRVIAMGYTDDGGHTSIPLHFFDTYYRILVLDSEGNIDKTSSKAIFYTSPYEVVVGNAPELNVFGDIVTTCTYDDTVDNFICDVTDTSGLMSSSLFYVREQRTVTHDIICRQTATTSSATYNCSIPNAENLTYTYYIGVYDSDGNVYQVDGGNLEGLTKGSTIYGDTGYYLAFMIFLTFVFLGSFLPTASILMGVFSFVLIDILELIPLSDGAVFSLILVAAVIIIKLWRDSP